MASFFADVPAHRPGLAVFLNAGDPPLDVLADVVAMLDERRVDCLELAVPFPDSVTDGPVVKASARRALGAGTGLDETIAFVDAVRPSLSHLRIALFVDWRHTVRPLSVEAVVRQVGDSAVDGLLVHAIPPRSRPPYYEAAARAGVPVVATCYAGSADEVVADAAASASAYVYLASRSGRTGGGSEIDSATVGATVARLRSMGARTPIAVGFGVRSAADVAAVHGAGADAAIVGSAFVSCLEGALAAHLDVPRQLAGLVDSLRPDQPESKGELNHDHSHA